ncbi:MAG: rRNA maturation RNase YbeY [Archangiaceae bacterium]|nr:rRNA maturation RNase YbeY [Archangiaceae bacterium]
MRLSPFPKLKGRKVTVTGGGKQGQRLKRVALGFLRALKLDGVELSLSIVTDAQIRHLNKQWRHKDKATDVLSFPTGDALLGDVVISLQTGRRVARELGVSLETELNLYLAHGLLHLLGYDHHRRVDRVKMARAERKLLGDAGMLTRR